MPASSRQKRLRAFDPYIARIGRLMGLAHWTISRSDDRPENPLTVACVQPAYGRHWARMWLSDLFLEGETPQDQRDTIVHEHLHLHLAAADRIAQDNLPKEVLPQFEMAMEYAVDGMAKAWSELLPLPPQPKKKG